MDSFLRRVYFSVAGVLIILWLGMFSWAVKAMKPDLMAFISAPPGGSPPAAETPISLPRVPGFQFVLYRSKPGDTFQSLAAKFNLLETTLRSLNQFNRAGIGRP